MERLSCLVVLFTFFVGSTLAGKSPVLVCHVPLELKIFGNQNVSKVKTYKLIPFYL